MSQTANDIDEKMTHSNPWDVSNLQKASERIFAHDIAEKMYLQRAAVAMSYGFPASVVTRNPPDPPASQPAPQKKNSLWPILLTAASCIGGTGLGAWSISNFFQPEVKKEIETVIETIEPEVAVSSEVIPPE